MKQQIILTIFAVMILSIVLPTTSASLGTYKMGSCVDIKTILNTTAVNISTISYPNSSVIVSNQPMDMNDYTFNYTFCNTSAIGNYIYSYVDAEGNVYVNDFMITPTGDVPSSSRSITYIILSIILFVIMCVLITIGFTSQKLPLIIIGIDVGMTFAILLLLSFMSNPDIMMDTGIFNLITSIYSWYIWIFFVGLLVSVFLLAMYFLKWMSGAKNRKLDAYGLLMGDE